MRAPNSTHSRRSVRGAVLVIALIMLVLTTLIAVSVFEMGSSNLLVITNLGLDHRLVHCC